MTPRAASASPLMDIITTLVLSALLGSACGPPPPPDHAGASGDQAFERSLIDADGRAYTQDFHDALARDDVDGAQLQLNALRERGVVDAPTAELIEARLRIAEARTDEALLALITLREHPDATPQHRDASFLYEALAHAHAGTPERALERIDAARDAQPHENPLIAERDHAELQLLQGELAWRSDDMTRAARRFSLAHESARGVQQVALEGYARQRVFDAVHAMDAAAQRRFLEEDASLLRAAAGYEQVRAHVEAGERERALEILGRVAPDLQQADELVRLAELEQTVTLTNSATHILVGAVLPLTGTSRRVGRRVMAGLLQAQGTFFPSGRSRLTLVFKDSQSDPERAAQAVRELADLGALAVVGPLGQLPSQAAADAAEALDLPLISLAVDGSLAEIGEHVFRYGLDTPRELTLLIEHARRVGAQRVLILHPDTAYGRTLADTFQVIVAETRDTAPPVAPPPPGDEAGAEVEPPPEPLSVIDVRAYDPDDRDHRKLAERVAELDFDTVFIPDAPDQATLIAAFLAQQNIWTGTPRDEPNPRDPRRFVHILGTSAWYYAPFLAQPDRYLDNAVFPTPYALEHDASANQIFVQTFRELYDRDPGLYESLGYDTMRLLRELILTRGLQRRDRIATQLQALQGWSGVTGPLQFSPTGDASPHVQLMQLHVEGGPTFITVEAATEPDTSGEDGGDDEDESPAPAPSSEPATRTAPLQPSDPADEDEEPTITDPLNLPGLDEL